MAEHGINPAQDNGRDIVARELAAIEVSLAPTDQQVDVSQAIKLPLDKLPELGIAFASLPSAFRTITSTVNVPTLLQATDKFGNAIDPSVLHKFHDGSGLMGTFSSPGAGGLSNVRLHVVQGDIATAVTQVPYDPTALFMAAAVAQINQKLDAIQASVDELFQFERQRSKAELRGSLNTLLGILGEYGNNCSSDRWMTNEHMKVLDIKQEAEQKKELFRTQAQGGLQKRGLVEGRNGVSARLNKVLDYLMDYQLASYVYAFSLFLEPMLAESFEPDRLAAIRKRIEDETMAYRKLYSACCDALEASAANSVDTIVLGGIASAGKRLGKAVAATPVGDKTLIDEALEGAGKGLDRLNNDLSERLTARLVEAKVPDLTPFSKCLGTVNALHNEPTQIAVDRENVYILPALTNKEQSDTLDQSIGVASTPRYACSEQN